MKNNDRRGSRGAFSTGAAGRPRWAWALALTGMLAGCQTNPPVPPELAELQSPPARPKLPSVEPLVLRVVHGPSVKLAGLDAAATGVATDRDLIATIRGGLRLPRTQDASVDREMRWFASHPAFLERVLARSESYLHYIVEALERRGMPLDLALLPVVESAFDPFAYSHGRAAGLWQIIPGTGKRLGLKQNWWYDGRRDVLESTRAALDYLQYLNDMFDGDWLLAVAGYNSGEGNVTRAIRRAEAADEPTDFWHIERFLPNETRTYVPRLLALGRLVAAPERYDLTLPLIPDEPYFAVVDVEGQIDLALAAEISGVDVNDLYRLNPGFNRWATDPDGPHRLLVPVAKAPEFQGALSALDPGNRIRWSRHTVRRGDTLSRLASTYRSTPQALREINDLPSDLIRVGQTLIVPQAAPPGSYSQTADARAARIREQSRDGQRRSHRVRAGESLWSISRRYGVGVQALARWNAMAPGDPLRTGRELVIWTEPAGSALEGNMRIRRLTYTVRKGDSLSRISNRFRVTVPELMEWNELSPDRYLQPGQRLVMYVDVTEQTG